MALSHRAMHPTLLKPSFSHPMTTTNTRRSSPSSRSIPPPKLCDLTFEAFIELINWIAQHTGLPEEEAGSFAAAIGDTPETTENGDWTATVDGKTIVIPPFHCPVEALDTTSGPNTPGTLSAPEETAGKPTRPAKPSPRRTMHPAYLETRFIAADGPQEWPEQFAIITAYATTGEFWTDDQNEAANQALEAELRATGWWMRWITGYSPTTSHREPGWAVSMDWQAACDLGARFLQDAIYVVHGDALTVTFCDQRRELLPVGNFLERLTAS